MQNQEQKLIYNEDFNNLSKAELIESIKNARLETFKYVNKFLEVGEKWAFINLLLKKLNSTRQKGELCQIICDGFLDLTNSKVCSISLFNQDNRTIEFSKIAYEGKPRKSKLLKFINNINLECIKFFENFVDFKDISDYFESISGQEFIIVPILHSQIFWGYLMLIKEDKNFYKENIHFINIFPEHIALILENISLYQESEKQNKRKMEFLAGISHEFKTPLNSILGFAEVLDSKNILEENAKFTKNILQSAKHLLTLIEDILDVSKSQYKSLELNYSTFAPKNEIVQIVNALEEMIKEKNINMNYTISDIKISADIKRFRQLIYNLISNAIKFNKQNGKINIFTYVKDNKFFFEIVDTGDGISKKNYDKIFDFFSQVNRSQLKRQSGSGVGLALCKMIVDAHLGEISFESRINKGSSFYFNLPL